MFRISGSSWLQPFQALLSRGWLHFTSPMIRLPIENLAAQFDVTMTISQAVRGRCDWQRFHSLIDPRKINSESGTDCSRERNGQRAVSRANRRGGRQSVGFCLHYYPMATSLFSISVADKRVAMARVLQSKALSRSEQLRSFLQYVCDAEIAGEAHKINEYAIGVTALGRSSGYSPAEDSCVRTRAYELRNKLRVFYEQESRGEAVRISIEKGAYVPSFEAAPSCVPSAGRKPANRLNEAVEVQLLWEPFRASSAPLLIAFDLRLFFYAPATGLVVRHFQTNDSSEIASSQPLQKFQEKMDAEQLLERHDYADFGAVHAAFLLGRLLAQHPHNVGMKHSGSLDWQDVWNSNLVFLGKPDSNPIVRSFLKDKPFYFDESGILHNAAPAAGEAAEYHCASTHGTGEKHALITRVNGPQPDRYLLLLCGTGAELMWALGESVTEQRHVRAIMTQLVDSKGNVPENFQVVIRATFQSNVPVNIQYVTHRALPSDSAVVTVGNRGGTAK